MNHKEMKDYLKLYGLTHPYYFKNYKRQYNELHNIKNNYKYKKKHNSLHPDRNKARNLSYYVIKHNKLIRPNLCTKCLKECIPHAHHPDYSKPLDVIWMCKKCHNDLHKQK